MRPGLVRAVIVIMAGALGAHARAEGMITGVSVSGPFFNPSLSQKIGISFNLAQAGNVGVLILDRDGYPVRRLVSGEASEKGTVSFDWDGRNDAGEVVADEAYSLKIDLAAGGRTFSFFPANVVAEQLEPRPAPYDRLSGIVTYKLPVPARVHIQAGSARVDKKTGQVQGPVLKTIADREPRTGGPVIETWNGWDESGSIRVCDLPNFAIAVAATPLPEASIIAVGNRKTTFFDWVRGRSGSSLLTVVAPDHKHHRGLSSLDDVAPRLQLRPRGADWSASEKLWVTSGKQIRLDASVEGPTAQAFVGHPGKLMVFLDLKNVMSVPVSSARPSITVPIRGLAAGSHRLTVDWVSDYGPVAVNSLLFRNGKAATAQGGR